MDPGDLNHYKDKFDAVWRRVMSENAEASTPARYSKPNAHGGDFAEASRLRDFMDDEACDAQQYALLARKFRSPAGQTLMSISSDERHHLKKLKVKYFILTGKTYTPPGSCPFISSVRETLRQKFMGEAEGAKAYLDAAADTAYDDLSETYRTLAADEQHHSQLLGGIIETLF